MKDFILNEAKDIGLKNGQLEGVVVEEDKSVREIFSLAVYLFLQADEIFIAIF